MGAETVKPTQRYGCSNSNSNNELLSERFLTVHPQGITCCLVYRGSLIICGCVDVIKVIPIKCMKEYKLIKSTNTVGVYKLCEINCELFVSVDKWNYIHIWNVNKLNHKLINHINCISINQHIQHLLTLNNSGQLLLLVYMCNNAFVIVDVDMCKVINTIEGIDNINNICLLRSKEIVTMNDKGGVMVWEYIDGDMIKKLSVDWSGCDKCVSARNMFKVDDNVVVMWDNNGDELIEVNVDSGIVKTLMKLDDKYDDIQFIGDNVFIGRNKNGNCVLSVYDKLNHKQKKIIQSIPTCSIIAYAQGMLLLINEKEGSILNLNY